MRTVVVGAGGAGLWCAIHAADRGPVVLVASPVARESATSWAQGGIAAVVTTNDSFELHIADTMAAGAGLCDEDAVKVLVDEAPLAVDGLRRLGMLFDDEGAPTLEGGHSARRVLHAGGDASGVALLDTIVHAVDQDSRIERLDGRAVHVIVEGGRTVGVALASGEELRGDRVVLATGGACGIYGRHTGPDASTGAGLTLAWEAGAALADLEFVQFHPTALTVPGHPARLLTEALRGEGALLIDVEGHRFMPALHPRAELAPRDVVARAEFRVMEETAKVPGYGLSTDPYVFASNEWWAAIDAGSIERRSVEGTITDAQPTSMADRPEFRMRTADGSELTAARRGDPTRYVEGLRIRLEYVTLRRSPGAPPELGTTADVVIAAWIEHSHKRTPYLHSVYPPFPGPLIFGI